MAHGLGPSLLLTLLRVTQTILTLLCSFRAFLPCSQVLHALKGSGSLGMRVMVLAVRNNMLVKFKIYNCCAILYYSKYYYNAASSPAAVPLSPSPPPPSPSPPLPLFLFLSQLHASDYKKAPRSFQCLQPGAPEPYESCSHFPKPMQRLYNRSKQ